VPEGFLHDEYRNCGAFHKRYWSVAVDRETGKFDFKEYKEKF
jgi:hypothetical protein